MVNFFFLLRREIKYFTNFQNKMYQFLLFFQPLMFLAIAYFLRELRGDINSGRFVVATALISMWSYVLYSSGSSLISQKWNDTLNLLIASPTSLFQIILSKTISNSFIALISMVISFIYGKLIFRFNIGIENYGMFFLAVLVLLLTLSVVGLILSLVFVASQNAYDYQNLILTPVILICGVFNPIDNLPWFMKGISYLIPMTWGIQSVYESLASSPHMFNSMMLAILVSAIYLVITLFVVKIIENVLRKTGKLGAI
jgi:ABC-2 type transport system permease protein